MDIAYRYSVETILIDPTRR